jgi:hypothetical protein
VESESPTQSYATDDFTEGYWRRKFRIRSIFQYIYVAVALPWRRLILNQDKSLNSDRFVSNTISHWSAGAFQLIIDHSNWSEDVNDHVYLLDFLIPIQNLAPSKSSTPSKLFTPFSRDISSSPWSHGYKCQGANWHHYSHSSNCCRQRYCGKTRRAAVSLANLRSSMLGAICHVN